MATSNNTFSNAPTVPTMPATQRPNILEKAGMQAKHMIVIGSLGCLIMLALFALGGWWAWHGLFGSDSTATAAAGHTSTVQAASDNAVEPSQAEVQTRRAREVQRFSSIAQPDVVYAAAGGPPDCKAIGRRLYVGTDGQNITSYTCH